MSRQMKWLLPTGLLAAGLAVHAVAQEGRAPHPPMRGGAMHGAHGCPMMMHAAHAGSPAMLLKHREMLNLSDAQVQRLESIAANGERAAARLRPEMMRAGAALAEATAEDVDLQAAEAAISRLAQLHADAMMVHLRARSEARGVLEPEQRDRVDAMSAGMRGNPHKGGMMHGGPHGARPQGDRSSPDR